MSCADIPQFREQADERATFDNAPINLIDDADGRCRPARPVSRRTPTFLLPGGGAPARLPRLVGRARAIEIIAGAEDFGGELAERYGYVNRAVADDEFEAFVHTFATLVSGFDRQAIEELKSFVDPLTLPLDDEFPPQTEKFFAAVGRPEVQGRIGRLLEQGLQKPGPVEEKLGTFAARA